MPNEKELYARSEKSVLKQMWSNSFLNELELILEKCFLKPKNKKEHFITREKLEVEIIKLLQTQKKFITKDGFKQVCAVQAAFDKIENAVAKILSIDFVAKTIQLSTIHNKNVTRHLDEVMFFDVYSLEFLVAFEKQKIMYDFTYRDTFRFLTHVEPKPTTTTQYRPNYICDIGRK